MINKTSFSTLQNNSMRYMLNYVLEYESVKAGTHSEFRFCKDLFSKRNICPQNFYKFYRRYINAGRDEYKLLPMRRGPLSKYKEIEICEASDLEKEILKYRELGYNRYVIAKCLKKQGKICSPSTIYRILKKYGVSKLNQRSKEMSKQIKRDYAGSLLHIDSHYLPKGVISKYPNKRYYVLGAIDDYSRVCWVEVMESVKAIDATFAMMDIIMLLHERYGIKGDEALTDNGSEFCGSVKTRDDHPFERLLRHFGIKHRRTRPYRPQTNGKIERFWRSFNEDVIEGAEFKDLDELKDAVLGYNFYYNEHRPHQGIEGKEPASMLESELDEKTKKD